jgi:AraC family transcriptional regulator
MEVAVRLEQPDLVRPDASRSLRWTAPDAPEIAILNGNGTAFEGGSDAPDLSLKWVPRGAAEYRSEGRSHRLAAGRQLMLNRGQPYRLRMLKPSETFVLFFPKPLCDAAWQALSGTGDALPEVPPLSAEAPLPLVAHVNALRTEAHQEKPDGKRLHEISLAVLTEMVALAAFRRGQLGLVPALRPTTRRELLQRLLRAQDYLSAVGADATLAGTAKAAALSPFHLIRAFRAVFGETPFAYAAGIRLDRARQTLLASRLPIAEVAQRAGYDSRTAFDRAFARRFGAAPGALRNS